MLEQAIMIARFFTFFFDPRLHGDSVKFTQVHAVMPAAARGGVAPGRGRAAFFARWRGIDPT